MILSFINVQNACKKFTKFEHGFERVGSSHRFVAVKGGQKIFKDIYNMEVTPHDVWVITYPRSGTTWTQEMVWNILNNLDFEKARQTDIDQKFFFLDLDFLVSGSHGGDPGFVCKAVAQVGKQRLIKTHLPIGLLPPDLLNKCKVIYVARNPKDVVVSYYHHHKLTKSATSDLEFREFVKFFMNELLVEDPYISNVQQGVAAKNHPNVKFLWYEDMKRDLPKAIREVAKFLGKELNESQVAALADYLDVKNMKQNPSVNHKDRHER